jgi:hypothetical protein
VRCINALELAGRQGVIAAALETSIETTNYGASLVIAAIYCFRVLTLPFVRSLVFLDFSGAMTLEMSLNENTSSASFVSFSVVTISIFEPKRNMQNTAALIATDPTSDAR